MVTVRYRHVLSQSKGGKGGKGGKASYESGGTNRFENFARVIHRQVAFEYAKDSYDLIQNQIKQRMHADIQRELNAMARLFMYGVVGIPGKNAGPRGQLRTVAPKSEAMSDVSLDMPVRQLVPGWTPRSPKYMAQRRGYGSSWFRRTGPGSLDTLASAKTWTRAFGGVSISVKRHTNLSKGSAPAGLRIMSTGVGGRNERVGIATISVAAMNRITPEMLPVLGGGGMGQWGANPRRSGLLSMLGDPIAWRLGGNPSRVPFRPTIHPFLSFFLTRQLPNAVFKRLEQGLGTSNWKRADTGSVGRTR